MKIPQSHQKINKITQFPKMMKLTLKQKQKYRVYKWYLNTKIQISNHYTKTYTETDHINNMKQTFVNNVDQLVSANENQRIKINYLETEKQKREEYLSGLKESIMLNKQTLIVLNEEGPNNPALATASKENHHLIKQNQALYTQNRQLNALLLMEQQLRVQDKIFYSQRISQFQNRITDLRKYLHDKEESFSSVVGRLKKYEEWNQKPLSEKIQDTQGLRKVTTEIMAQVMAEKNMFKAKFEEVFPDAQRFKVLFDSLKNPKNLSRFVNQINQSAQRPQAFSQGGSPRQHLVNFYMSQHKSPFSKEQKPQTAQFKQNQITKQLMRLLKKEKLNNHILQTALHSAIEKNQELLKINQNLEIALQNLEKKMEKLIAQNYFYKLRIKQFAYGYGKKYVMSKVKEASDQPAFQQLFKLNFEIKDQENQEVATTYYKDLLKQSLKEDIQKFLKIPLSVKNPKQLQNISKVSDQQRMTEMTTHDNTRMNEKMVKSKIDGNIQRQKESQNVVSFNQKKHQKMMIKSASEPRFFIQWQDGAQQDYHHDNYNEEMVIDEF